MNRLKTLILTAVAIPLSVMASPLAAPGQKEPASPISLERGLGLIRSIQNGEVHGYRRTLGTGENLNVIIDQPGADIAWTVTGPDGQRGKDKNDRPGSYGREYLRLEAAREGTYALELRPARPDAPSGRYRPVVRNVLTAAEALEKVACPALWFLGDRDGNVPSAESEKRIKAALANGGNQDSTVLRLSPAGHVLIESQTGFFDDIVVRPAKFAAGYWDVMGDWIQKRIPPENNK